jgi:hypothetical protein
MRTVAAGVLALLTVGCSAAPAAPATPPAGGQQTAPTAPTSAPAAPEAPAGEPSSAVVTIGEERFQLSGLRCVTLGGFVGVQTVAGPTHPRIDIEIPPPDWETSTEDWDPPSVRVIASEGNTWIANPEATALMNIEPGLSQVDSFTSDGFHATGTATFMHAGQWQRSQAGLEDEPPVPIQGTFELTCPRR